MEARQVSHHSADVPVPKFPSIPLCRQKEIMQKCNLIVYRKTRTFAVCQTKTKTKTKAITKEHFAIWATTTCTTTNGFPDRLLNLPYFIVSSIYNHVMSLFLPRTRTVNVQNMSPLQRHTRTKNNKNSNNNVMYFKKHITYK